MNSGSQATLLVRKIGPYHDCRLNAAAVHGQLNVIEYRAGDPEYLWEGVETEGRYRSIRCSLVNLSDALQSTRPETIVCVGYADREIHAAMRWATRANTPLAVCSDSTWDDEPREMWRETFKRALLGAFQSGLVAGTRSRAYLQRLGLSADRIFTAWDVVDNRHFHELAEIARSNAAQHRAQLRSPRNYFFSPGRFVRKKNTAGLLRAYCRYLNENGHPSWDLVLSGGGALEGELRSLCIELKIGPRVHFTGVATYTELPARYGLAGAVVLPSLSDQWGLVVNEAMAAGLPVIVSSRCGCVPDLVENGKNGLVFDPADERELSRALTTISALPLEQRAAMGQRSREIVERFSPEVFAKGFWRAVECAQRHRHECGRWSARLALAALGLAQRG